jgi:hypothetical protein
MTRTQFAVTLVVVAVAGLVGGALSERMRGRPAVAQAADEPLAIDRLVVDDLVAKSILVDGDNDQRVFLQNNAVTLVTDDGVRAAFRLDADGNPSVDLVDSKGKSRAEFGLWTDAGIGGLLLRNAEGAHLAELKETPGLGSSLDLRDPRGASRVLIGPGTNGEWRICLAQAGGEIKWSAP